jgi:putative holliday junction resolvase
MRVLALDYGPARCGCALSDPSGTIVTPIDAIRNAGTRRGLSEIRRLVEDRAVERVVVGLPVTLRGTDSEQTRATRAFAERLAGRLGRAVPVELHDERFTSALARREHGSVRAGEDSRAAAHLLESWLLARTRD